MLTDTEQNLKTSYKECPDVVWTVLVLRLYLWASHFMICTDHKPLKLLLPSADALDKLERCRLTLLNLYFNVVSRAGIRHQVSDKLSRL